MLKAKHWSRELQPLLSSSEFNRLWSTVKQEYLNKRVAPQVDSVFRAYDLTDLDAVKVVILGQD